MHCVSCKILEYVKYHRRMGCGTELFPDVQMVDFEERVFLRGVFQGEPIGDLCDEVCFQSSAI